MRTKSIGWFEGKISQVLSRNPNITIHELAIAVLRNQKHSKVNEFNLDVALVRAQKQTIVKNTTDNQITLLAA